MCTLFLKFKNSLSKIQVEQFEQFQQKYCFEFEKIDVRPIPSHDI